eukprot:gene19867-25819_t
MSTITLKSTNNTQIKTLNKSKSTSISKPKFLGPLQPCESRVPAIPDVDYSKGGDDFRCPKNTTSLGRQILGLKHYKTSASVTFGNSNRFLKSETLGPGPLLIGQSSSMQKQILSKQRTAEKTLMGTSSRDDISKLYVKR